MSAISYTRLYDRFIERQSNFKRTKLHRTNHSSNFLRSSFKNRDNVRDPIQSPRERQPQDRPIHFPINSTSVSRPVKRNNLSFSSIAINKRLTIPVHSVSQIRFKFSSQLQLLPQIRYLITLRVESSIIIIGSNIFDNIIRRVINVCVFEILYINGSRAITRPRMKP